MALLRITREEREPRFLLCEFKTQIEKSATRIPNQGSLAIKIFKCFEDIFNKDIKIVYSKHRGFHIFGTFDLL